MPTSTPEYYAQAPYPPPPPPPSTSHAAPRKPKRPLLIVAILVVLTLAGVGAWVLIGKATGPGKFTAKGTFTVYSHYDSYLGSSGVSNLGDTCQGADGYDDIREGTQVTISVDNKVVAYGELGPGLYVRPNCMFSFEVTGVPAGTDRYSVEISHRGNLFYQEKELRQGVDLEIGQDG